MQRCVLDASVFIKLFLPAEPDSATARKVMTALLDAETRILAPRLFYYEVLATAMKCHIPTNAVLDMLADYEATLLTYVEETPEMTKTALALCTYGNEKSGFANFYDSIYHALAIQHACTFITADKRHYDKTHRAGHIQLLNTIT